MDIKKLSQIENPVPQEIRKTNQSSNLNPGAPSFAETLQGIQSPTVAGLNSPKAAGSVTLPAESVKFSNHAVDRMMSRGIQFSKEDLGKLSEAIDRASKKGSKDSLILMNDSALIVSVKNKTVVTVMDKNALKENVFTNIDSTIVM